MADKKDRKRNLATVRITSEEMETLDYLSDCMDKSKSDTLLRACKFFLNTDRAHKADTYSDTKRGEVRKKQLIHFRMTDEDMDSLSTLGEKVGATVSQIIRKAIKEYGKSQRRHF